MRVLLSPSCLPGSSFPLSCSVRVSRLYGVFLSAEGSGCPPVRWPQAPSLFLRGSPFLLGSRRPVSRSEDPSTAERGDRSLPPLTSHSPAGRDEDDGLSSASHGFSGTSLRISSKSVILSHVGRACQGEEVLTNCFAWCSLSFVEPWLMPDSHLGK